MKRLFTPIFLTLFLSMGGEQVFAEDSTKYPGKIGIKCSDSLSANFMSFYNPVDISNTVSRGWRLRSENQKIEDQDGLRARPILNLGSVPEVLKYQSSAVLQWGYSHRDLILLLRIGVKAEDFNHLDFQPKRENNHLISNLNFLIDFWFKW